MKKHIPQSGFTLVEMLVAVMILTMAVTALLSVSAGSSVSARYAKNKMVANWLAQSSLDYIRNSRDTALIANTDPLSTAWWNSWLAGTLGTPGTMCFGANGCYVNIPSQTNNSLPLGVSACGTSGCPNLRTDTATGQYSNVSINSTVSPFRVTVTATSIQSPDIVEVKATVTWVEGTQNKSLTQSITLSNWSL